MEATLASLALGEESAWMLVTGVAALAAGGLAFRSIRQAFARHLHLPTGGYYQKLLLVFASLVVSTILSGASWIIALFFFFATGVMLD